MENLNWLINPVSAQEFCDQYLEKKPLLIQREQQHYYNELINLEGIESIVRLGQNLSNYDIQMINANRKIHNNEYCSVFKKDQIEVKTGIDLSRTQQIFRKEKSSLIINNVSNSSPEIDDFIFRLSKDLDGTCDANIFITPPGVSTSLGVHFDLNDIYVLQLYGSKRWEVYDSPIYLPHKPFFYQRFDNTSPMGNKLFDIELNAGSLLYLPKGFVHNVSTTKNMSVHIGIACSNRIWADALTDSMIDIAFNHEVIRKSIIKSFSGSNIDDLSAIKNVIEKHLTMELIDNVISRSRSRLEKDAAPNLSAILDKNVRC